MATIPRDDLLGDDDDRIEGCTCHWRSQGGNDPDAHMELDEWCPVHGRDPDYERDRMNDDANDRFEPVSDWE